MNHLFNLILITLLLVNLLGIGAGTTRLTQLPYGLAKSFAVLVGCLVFFFFEHFIGIGYLGWLLPVSTVGSIWILWKDRSRWRQFLGGEMAFLFGFSYTLLWRYSFPDIDASSEQLADLDYVTSYLQGGRLPVADLWLSPYLLTQYYSFQHYAAALMGRILQLGPGTSYNLAYCVVVGLVMAPAQAFVRSFTKGDGGSILSTINRVSLRIFRPLINLLNSLMGENCCWKGLKNLWIQTELFATWGRFFQILILSALLMGGTGACFFTPWLVKNPTLWSSMRFVGSTTADNDSLLTPAGIRLREYEYGKGEIDEKRHEDILELPMEIFSYVVQLGDYHPPLGGYVLLASALASFGVLLRRPKHQWAIACLVGTVPFCIAVNTWCFPLQGLLVIFCVGFIWKYRERPDLVVAAGAIFITVLLLYPYFSYFLTRNVGSSMSVKWVQPSQHTPFLTYLMQFWPVISLVILAWFGVGSDHKNFRWFAVAVAVFLILTEVIYFHDIYGGRFERFNTTLKWWPWVAFLAVLLLAPIILSEGRPFTLARAFTILILLSVLVYVEALASDWIHRPKTSFGKLDGEAWLWRPGSDPEQPQNLNITHSVVNYLLSHPDGVVMEAPVGERMAFVETGAIPLISRHPTVFGWASHEQLWRGYQKDIEQRWNRSREFFRGDLKNPLDFLEGLKVRYILWPIGEPVEPALFEKISSQINSNYYFLCFDEGDPHHGIWAHR